MAKRRIGKTYKKIQRKDAAELAIPAGLFLGIGIGLITGQVAGGVLIGLGLGFLLLMIIKLVRKK
jgi:hypothetical protein